MIVTMALMLIKKKGQSASWFPNCLQIFLHMHHFKKLLKYDNFRMNMGFS